MRSAIKATTASISSWPEGSRQTHQKREKERKEKKKEKWKKERERQLVYSQVLPSTHTHRRKQIIIIINQKYKKPRILKLNLSKNRYGERERGKEYLKVDEESEENNTMKNRPPFTSHENEDVSFRKLKMNLQRFLDSSVDVVFHWCS